MSQGAEANMSGQFVRKLIETEFRNRSVPIFDYVGNKDNGDLLAPHFVIRRVPYTTIYGLKTSSDDLVYRQFWDALDVRIVCSWQEQSGSVDQKFPYMLWNASRAMPEKEVWLVVDGGGHRPEAVAWLKDQATKVEHKTIRVLNINETRRRIKEIATAAKKAVGAA